MKMLFYGAGHCGKEALEVYNSCAYKEENMEGFIDSKKKGNFCGYPVFPVSEVEDKNVNVVITIYDLRIVGEVYNHLKRNGFLHIFWFKRKDKKKVGADFLEEECIDCSNWGECVLPKVEMHIADYCNLNCKGCTHFSPIFAKVLPDFEERIKDVKLLKEKIPHVLIFSILGGEPFLNPEIDLYVTEVRKVFPNTFIQIVTNGLLIPKLEGRILECIKENKIAVQISEYKPTHKIIDRIEAKLKEHGVTYYIQAYEAKEMFVKPLSLSEHSRYPQKCISEGCVNIWNGKISKCPTLMYIDQFNEKFNQNLPNEGIMQLEDCPEGFQLLDVLDKEVPLCRHCVYYETEWEQCGVNPSMEDFTNMD